MGKLRVLVIDDSAYNRQAIGDILTSHPEIEVVGKAFDGEEGLKLAVQLRPDLITLDIEMPRMDGFTFLRLLMSKMPVPVIVISSHSRKQEVFRALELGALDFIAKPGHHISPDIAGLRDELIAKALTVRSLERLPVQQRSSSADGDARAAAAEPAKPAIEAGRVERVVCVGASTGGPPALEALFRALQPTPGTAYLVSQHMPEKFTHAFAERLNRMAALNIQEAQARMVLRPGGAYVAPGGSHMEVTAGVDGEWVIRLEPRQPEDRYVPSVDRMLRSAAHWFKGSVLAAILTGMGNDGAQGALALHKAGGLVIAESAEPAIVFGMPKEAQLTGAVTEMLPLPLLIDRIRTYAGVSSLSRVDS